MLKGRKWEVRAPPYRRSGHPRLPSTRGL